MSTTSPDDALFSRARAAMRDARGNRFAVLTIVAEIDVVGTGYPSTERLLEDLFHIDRRDAKRLVRHAAALMPGAALSGEPLPPRAPATAEHCADGTIDAAHVDVLLDALDRLARIPDLAAHVLAEAEETLAEAATYLPPRALAKVADRLVATLDPDGAAPDDADPVDELHLGTRRDGPLTGKFRFHAAADREMVREALDALSAPAGPDDPRSLATRQAEAFLDLVAQAVSPTGIAADAADAAGGATCGSHLDDSHPDDGPTDGGCLDDGPPDGGERDGHPDDGHDGHDGHGHGHGHGESDSHGESDGNGNGNGNGNGHDTGARPRHGTGPGARSARGCPPVRVLGRGTLNVTMDLRWLRERVGHGTVDSESTISPAEARRLACDAGLVPMVLGTRSEPLDVGRLSYTVPENIRRALIVRDGGCAFPGCTRRPNRCAAHHIRHWADGGATALHNLTLLCRYHHKLMHHDHWRISMRDGHPWFVPPRWIDPQRRPRPGDRCPPP